MKSVASLVVDGVVFVEEAPRNVKRAPAVVRVVPVAEKRSVSGLDYCLDVWTRWQHQDDTRLGFRGRCAIVETDYDEEYAADSEILYSAMDTRVAEAVEAMMKSLPRHLDWAIRQRCRVATVWRFPSLAFGEVLPEAEAALTVLLQKNIATRCFFV